MTSIVMMPKKSFATPKGFWQIFAVNSTKKFIQGYVNLKKNESGKNEQPRQRKQKSKNFCLKRLLSEF